MKKFSIFLYVVAFVIAISSAYASASSQLQIGYVLINGVCTQSIDCTGTGATCFDAQGRTVFSGLNPNPPTHCGTPLERSAE